MPDHYWKIDRYARLSAVCPKTGTQWKQYDDTDDVMTLMLSDVHQLVISQGSTILVSHLTSANFIASSQQWYIVESHSLLCARNWMRGVCRNDSLLFVCRIEISGKTETRKFRVRFCDVDNLSGSDQCSDCVEKLQQFFPVKLSVAKQATEAADSIQALLTSERLPMAYLHHHHHDLESIQQMLRVCLADPAFPAFVQAVETELKTVVGE
ncbi:meiotic recombination protein rec114-like [Plakobranchus ocellatus]|uniref:Meiotic recombination protein rec114-like n=1 Tax=Plakobranchus ocellatus TaxID=259542 RepID=A0AAV3Z6E6_9GAST|nr:meiotic recombination protein rec114-like [Plakobranchus ocellatus]